MFPEGCEDTVARRWLPWAAIPLNKSTTYHAPPPLLHFFFAPTSVPQSDQRDEAAISHHICRGLEPPRPL